jgi:hypothetical protein|tara:strand:- start:1065 stop:1232 length:168 start_codon:yes stop_codon:yes gene_type:complete
MTINKNTLVGIGAIGAGLLFAYRARLKGKDIPIVGELILPIISVPLLIFGKLKMN